MKEISRLLTSPLMIIVQRIFERNSCLKKKKKKCIILTDILDKKENGGFKFLNQNNESLRKKGFRLQIIFNEQGK